MTPQIFRLCASYVSIIMGFNRDHRTAQEKWEQLMAEARSTERPWLFEHRRPLPEHRETWHHSTKDKRICFPEESSAILCRGNIPYGFRDDTEDELTTKVTALGPLLAIPRNHGDDYQTETRIAKIVKLFRENPCQTAQNLPCSSMKSSRVREIPIETRAGPSWMEWCAWDEEYLWDRFAILNLQYKRLAPFGQSWAFMDLGYENARRNMTKRRGTPLHNTAVLRVIVQQRFWNLAVQRARKPLLRDWRMLQKQQLYVHDDHGFRSFSEFTDPTTVLPSEEWINCLIKYISLQKAQDARYCDFLAKGVYDSVGRPCSLSDGQCLLQHEINNGARKSHAVWSESIHLADCATRRPSDPPLAWDKDSNQGQQLLPGPYQEFLYSQETTYGHDRWRQRITPSRVASPHLLPGMDDLESRIRTPSLTKGWVTAGDCVHIHKNPLGSIGGDRRRQEAPRGYRHC